MVDWVEQAFFNTSYQWQWTAPIESDWIRVRQDLYNYPKVYKYLWGMICQGTNIPLTKFQVQKLYQSETQYQLFYFPRPPILLPSERRIGILGQRYLQFKNEYRNASWVVHIDTPRIPINPILPDPEQELTLEQKVDEIRRLLVDNDPRLTEPVDVPVTLL
jgi:hypothetical protein